MDQDMNTDTGTRSATYKKAEILTEKKEAGAADQSIPFLKLFSFASPLDVVLMLIGSVGGVVNGVIMPVMTLFFGQLIDAFGKNVNKNDTLAAVSQVCLRFVYVAIGAFIASFCQVTCWIAAGERQAARIRGLYLKAILRQDVAFFDKELLTGEVVGRMSGDTILIQDAMGEKVGKALQLFSTFIGGFVIAFVKGWKLTLMMLATFPPLVFVGAAFMMTVSKAASRGQNAYAQAGDVAEQAIGAIRTVAAFAGEKKFIEAYRKKQKTAYKAAIYQGMASGFGIGVLTLILFSTYSLAFWYGARLILSSGYSGGTVVNVVFAVLTGGMSLGQASPSLNAFGAGKAAAYKMFEVIDRVPDIDAYNVNGQVLKSVRGDLEFRNVDFSYPARPEVKIFSNFSIHIPEGLTAALVGESGSGKSTAISLIERFYDPQGGYILLDGVDIKQLQLKWLRQQIGLVSQEPVLFGTSIEDNIAYGKDGATLEEVQQAALLANAASFISRLPLGYDTLVGEHGTQLSGGQKQRVAIARAILKNPCILLLDEATSALDAESERLVQEAVDRVMMGRTTVVVAHRLSTIRNADLIAVVQHGVIVEQGKHDELLQKTTGAYSQLIRLQNMHQDDDFKEQEELGEILSSHNQRSGRIGSSRSSWRSSSLNSESDRSTRWASLYQSRSETATWPFRGKRFLHCCMPNVVENDLEIGEGRSAVSDVSIFRLASLNKPETPIYVIGSLFAVVNGCIYPLYGILMSGIIKTYYEPRDKMRKDANFWASIFLVVGCIAFTVMPIQAICFSVGGNRLIERLRQLTFEKVLRQEISWFDEAKNSSGVISARLSGDAAQVRSIVGDTLSFSVQNCATIVAALVIAFSANWQLSLVILALVPLLGLQGLARVKFLQGFSADAKVMYEDASQVATDAVRSIRTVSSFCAEDKVLSLYHDKCRSPLQRGIRQGIMSGVTFGFANFVLFSANSLCFWFGAKLVVSGRASLQDVFRVFFAVLMGTLSVSQSTGVFPDMSHAKAAVNSVFALLDRQSKIDSSDSSGLIPESVVGTIEFKRVSFKYPSRPKIKVLRGFTLTIKSGKTVALVGESGCGKSTVIALLERFYDPDSGNIFLDGNDIKSLQVRWLRQQMGLVGQEPVLFNTTIRENIIYGIDGPVSEEQIVAAAEASNAHKFITDLPEGYSTSVGERGIQLSGGQKQRVAIARAIIKDPKILLLDEATSALDAESEYVVQEALERVMVERSVIVIAHRLSTIKNADIIAVVKNGVIIEKGQHEDLMRTKDGAYANLVRLHMASS